MPSTTPPRSTSKLALHPVGQDNWREIAKLEVDKTQQRFVAEPLHYLALCNYGDDWNPLAITVDEQVIGFLMWAIDPDDRSCWLGGILIDRSRQRQGYGRQAVLSAIAQLAEDQAIENFALSYQPANVVAKHLYASLGFVETNEWEDDEIVARLPLLK